MRAPLIAPPRRVSMLPVRDSAMRPRPHPPRNSPADRISKGGHEHGGPEQLGLGMNQRKDGWL